MRIARLLKFRDFRLIGARFPPYKSGSYDMGNLKFNLHGVFASGLLACSAPILAQENPLSQEAASRAEDAEKAFSAIELADEAYRDGGLVEAISQYNKALSMLPKGAPTVAAVRQLAVQRLVKASLAQCQNLRRTGDREAIEQLLANVDQFAPGDANVAKFRAGQKDPIRTNPALSPKHLEEVDQVIEFLHEAQGYYDLGQFDRAEMVYEDVLLIDPSNKAARRGLERVVAAKSEYGQAARDQARAKLLADVDEIWELKVPNKEGFVPVGQSVPAENGSIVNLFEKLNTINFPEVNLNNASLSEAIEYLRVMSVQLDSGTITESAKGVAFVINLGDEDHPAVKAVQAQRINLKLKSVPMIEVLEQITAATKTNYRVDEFAVVINAAGFSDPTLIRREFRVPPDFLTASTANQVQENDPFGGAQEGGLIAKRLTAVEKLKSFDLPFPEGATATYNAATNLLTVINTADNLALVESIVESASLDEPVIVAVRTTVIDISQENLEELGFDTMLGELSVGSAYSLSGGSTGSGVPINDMISGNPVTSGLRSGDLVNNSDGLDALLSRDQPQSATGTLTSGAIGNSSTLSLPPPSGSNNALRSPGAISLIGVVDNSAHQMMMRALSQKKGTDLMVRPQVMTRPGQNAVVQSVIEFIYPEEYEPPEIPNAVGGGDTVVTPSHPSSFTKKDLGVSLEVLPEVGADRKIIEVQVNPVITDFEGFVNYGSPITGSSTSTAIDFVGLTSSSSSTFGKITDNSILMPLFKTMRGKTAIRIADGQTIVMGGLLEEVSKTVNDKVPFLGDLPLVGRVFQNKGHSIEKRSVLIFVNVELLDPAGNPYRFR